jgi:hypothetical protein
MLIVQKVSKNEDGTWNTQWSLSDEQMSFLLTYAINDLLEQGLVQIEQVTVDKGQLELDFLSSVDTDSIGQAWPTRKNGLLLDGIYGLWNIWESIQNDYLNRSAYANKESIRALRDTLAASALQGLLATGKNWGDTISDGWEWHSRASYAMADAMLKERDKNVKKWYYRGWNKEWAS